jgi:hypothetical protein
MAEISRRTLLSRTALVAGLGVGAALGLTRTVHHKVAMPPPPAPAELVGALDRQRALLAGYDAVGVSSRAALPGLRSDVAAHGEALSGLLELYPGWRLNRSSGSTGTSPSVQSAAPDSIAGLAAASKSDAAALAAAAVHWPTSDPHAIEVLPVLGSIAACLAVHAEVLS